MRIKTDAHLLLAVGVFGRPSRLGERIEMLLKGGRSFSPQLSPRRVAVSATVLLALAAAGTSAPRWIALAQDPPRPKFEVASIKPGDPKDPEFTVFMRPGRFTTTNANLRQLVGFAYEMRDNQITGGPAWVSAERYSIEAKEDASPAPLSPIEHTRKVRLMLQSLLAERFRLGVHRETKEDTAFEMVTVKGGAKIKDSNAPERMRIGRGEIDASGATIAALIAPLSRQLGRSVVDKTGLAGTYDFSLRWSPNDDPEGVSVFTALQEQVGLKLESARARVDMLVIDRAEKPDAN